ncbi:hypothetical protein [Streptomyces sp. MZ04]|uniref:hypothetical protein n=1 Tax=Streptomyces sp. MZ04 TaxID=2559236 RepID=UPI00107ECF0D|nr:hypothetical protein [Streptomyces sp. MZ04]TGB08068.1 hypothetical protein E2651_20300 [Streptomyces sp. MZ04]
MIATPLVVNASTSFAFDGVKQVLISVGTGTVCLASGVSLALMKRAEKRAPPRSEPPHGALIRLTAP